MLSNGKKKMAEYKMFGLSKLCNCMRKLSVCELENYQVHIFSVGKEKLAESIKYSECLNSVITFIFINF